MIIYIAGPMTGLPDLNFPAFHEAAAALRAAGYNVVNPAEINPDHSMPWADCLRADIVAMMDCDWIALLPGWMDSRGARLERHIAVQLGMSVYDFEVFGDPPLVRQKLVIGMDLAKEPDRTVYWVDDADWGQATGTAELADTEVQPSEEFKRYIAEPSKPKFTAEYLRHLMSLSPEMHAAQWMTQCPSRKTMLLAPSENTSTRSIAATSSADRWALPDPLHSAVEAYQIAEQACAQRHADARNLIEPGIAVEAGLLAAAPFLVAQPSVPKGWKRVSVNERWFDLISSLDSSFKRSKLPARGAQAWNAFDYDDSTPPADGQAQQDNSKIEADLIAVENGLRMSNADQDALDAIAAGICELRRLRYQAAQQDAEKVDAREASEIIDSLIRSIEKDGPYSKESMLNFLRQAQQCLPAIDTAMQQGGQS